MMHYFPSAISNPCHLNGWSLKTGLTVLKLTALSKWMAQTANVFGGFEINIIIIWSEYSNSQLQPEALEFTYFA